VLGWELTRKGTMPAAAALERAGEKRQGKSGVGAKHEGEASSSLGDCPAGDRRLLDFARRIAARQE